jgi:hypothetical protein
LHWAWQAYTGFHENAEYPAFSFPLKTQIQTQTQTISAIQLKAEAKADLKKPVWFCMKNFLDEVPTG